jgi:hypothetical protein
MEGVKRAMCGKVNNVDLGQMVPQCNLGCLCASEEYGLRVESGHSLRLGFSIGERLRKRSRERWIAHRH